MRAKRGWITAMLWLGVSLCCLAVAGLAAAHWRPRRAQPAFTLAASRSAGRLGEQMAVARPAGRINPNTADEDTLCGLAGIGPALAKRIVEEREANGLFHYAEDLISVNGIGSKTLQRFADQITLE